MKLRYQGQLLTGTICNDGPNSSGLAHAVIYGEMQCKSGMNLGSRYLHVKVLDPTKTSLQNFIRLTDCSKCKAEMNKTIEVLKAEKAGA